MFSQLIKLKKYQCNFTWNPVFMFTDYPKSASNCGPPAEYPCFDYAQVESQQKSSNCSSQESSFSAIGTIPPPPLHTRQTAQSEAQLGADKRRKIKSWWPSVCHQLCHGQSSRSAQVKQQNFVTSFIFILFYSIHHILCIHIPNLFRPLLFP